MQSVEEENKQLQARLNDLIEQKEKLEQTVTQGNVGNKNEIESLKSDLENANAMIAALRNQRQELLAQIENLKFVKTLMKSKSRKPLRQSKRNKTHRP